MAADRFLDTEGLRHLWEKIKAWIPFLSRKTQSIPFGQVDSTSTSTAFTATVDGITELRDGVCCYLRNGVVSSASGYTININSLGAKRVYSSLSNAVTSTIFTVASTFLFVYNSTRISGGCWDVYYGYDSNATYNLNVNYTTIGRINVGAYPISVYSLCAFDVNDKLTPFVTAATTSTGKTLVSSTFPVGAKIYASNYSMSADTAQNDLGAILTTVASYDLRYSSVNHNVAIFPNNTFNRVFMPVIVDVANNTFTLTTQTTNGYTNNFTNERSLKADNFYIEIGFNANRSSSYYYTLIQENRLYYYDGTKLIEYSIYKSSIIDVPEYTIEKLANAETNYIASYILKKDNVQVGATINIPKDYLVKSGEVIDVVEYNGQYYDATDTGHTTPLPVTSTGKYLDLVVNTSDNSGTTAHVYVPLIGVGAVYTEGNGIDIDSNNVISVQIDTPNAHGLAVSSNGLSLANVVASTNGSGGSAGAMLATDKEKLDKLRLNSTEVILNGRSGSSGIQPWSLCAFAFDTSRFSAAIMYMTSFTATAGQGGGAAITGYAFPIGCKIYYHPEAQTYTASTNFTSKKFYSSYDDVDGRYSSNTGVNLSLSSSTSSSVYLRVDVDEEASYWRPYHKDGESYENICTPDGFTANNYYIYLGKTVGSTGYKFQLEDNNPLYYYDGNDLVDWASYIADVDTSSISQDLSGKADKVSNATSGNFAGLDANGNLTDSGHKHSDYLTSHQDISGKEDKSNKVTSLSSSSTDTQYPSAKVVYDQLATKQATLVSGTNIKTVNNTSLLGSGNIQINDGVGFQTITTQQDGTMVITLTNGDTITVDLNHVHPQYYSKVRETVMPQGGFLPDVVYSLGVLGSNITFALAPNVVGNVNHYYWTFSTATTVITVTWPTRLIWVNGSAPTIAANKHYEISILDNFAVYMETSIQEEE